MSLPLIFPTVLSLVLCYSASETETSPLKDVVVVILSQDNSYHDHLARILKADIRRQVEALQLEHYPRINLLHEDYPHVGGWTIQPLLPRLAEQHGTNSSWIIFVEDRTSVNVTNLVKLLQKYDHGKELWLGHALFDSEPTIIHHFAFSHNPHGFKYPNVGSGVLMTTTLLNRLLNVMWSGKSDFAIDSSHELALHVWDSGKGWSLTDEPMLCGGLGGENCATYPRPFEPCGDAIDVNSIYFAVKTCKKFHNDRVPIVQQTWAPDTRVLTFFSDVTNTTIPTRNVGVPNTEMGHCGKTIKILKTIRNELHLLNNRLQWIMLVDDDTILGVTQLRNLLSCYDPSTPTALGERYGYNVHHADGSGYNYITGGGGIVLSRLLLEKVASTCNCPRDDSPDDMILGACLHNLGVNVTHSPLFHQARPFDYPSDYLASAGDAVSFHKHWMIDPLDVYKKWFVMTGRDNFDNERVPNEEL